MSVADDVYVAGFLFSEFALTYSHSLNLRRCDANIDKQCPQPSWKASAWRTQFSVSVLFAQWPRAALRIPSDPFEYHAGEGLSEEKCEAKMWMDTEDSLCTWTDGSCTFLACESYGWYDRFKCGGPCRYDDYYCSSTLEDVDRTVPQDPLPTYTPTYNPTASKMPSESPSTSAPTVTSMPTITGAPTFSKPLVQAEAVVIGAEAAGGSGGGHGPRPPDSLPPFQLKHQIALFYSAKC